MAARGRLPLPVLGPRVPQRGNAISRAFGRLVFRTLGWQIAGNLPDIPKCVIVAAPHTSTWDIVIGVAAKVALGLDANWLGKHTVHRGPLGWLLVYLGGIPVDRTAPHGLVGEVAREFQQRERLFLGIAPEGTRQRVERWKSGFHRIARAAGVPIVPVAFDYAARTLRVGPPVAPTDDLDADVAVLKRHFRAGMAYHPERYAE